MEAARPASTGDIAAMATLAEAAAVELRDNRGGNMLLDRESHRLPADETLAAALDDDRQLVVVGTVDDVVVGYGVVRLEALHSGARLAVVDDLYVDPQARGIGVGEAIMDLLVDFATRHDAIGIDSIVLPGMRASKNFFETFGLVARAIAVHRPLPRDGSPESA